MRYNEIEKLIENIELKYTTILNDIEIEKLSGINATDITNKFVQITNISFDKYAVRRSLTLIINRIKDNKSKISSEDLSPWNSVQSFSKAFNNEFNIRPSKFLINYDEAILQNKIDIKKIELEENEIVEKVNYIMNKCNNNKIGALKYFYTLKPYILPFPYTLARGIHFYKRVE